MAKLTYWVCDTRNDSPAYNIRAKSKREAVAKYEAAIANGCSYDKPRKVEMVYRDAFDLMSWCLSEARGGE